MLVRAFVLLLALSVPAQARAAGYVIHPGDTLGAIAQRSHVSVDALARANGIATVNMIRSGRVLFIPRALPGLAYGHPWPYRFAPRWTSPATHYGTYATRFVPRLTLYRAVGARWTYRRSPLPYAGGGTYRPTYGSYRVRWGDTLLGLAFRYHTTVAAIRSMNPALGSYLLAGQPLNLCGSCASIPGVAQAPVRYSSLPVRGVIPSYTVRSGYRVNAIVPRYRTYLTPLAPQYRAVPRTRIYPTTWRTGIRGWGTPYGSWQARSLIAAYARQYGLERSLPLAIGAQESGFRQTAISGAGAVGVMQVEPHTAVQISSLLGRPVNLYSLDDNIHAGVFWLAHLVAQYGGNERLAAAAYYQGSSALARRGLYSDTVRYVSNAMSLRTRYR